VTRQSPATTEFTFAPSADRTHTSVQATFQVIGGGLVHRLAELRNPRKIRNCGRQQTPGISPTSRVPMKRTTRTRQRRTDIRICRFQRVRATHVQLTLRDERPAMSDPVVEVHPARRDAAAAGELARVDALLDDERFFGPFRAYFDVTFGQPSIPMEMYLRLMF
jgi:hypothetical protein